MRRGRRQLPAPLHGVWGVTTLLALVLCAVLGTVPGSSAAFTAGVANTTNTLGLNPYFTCRAAEVGDGAYFSHPFDDTPPSNQAAARDVSGNNRPGTYQTAAVHSTSSACTRDGGGSTTFNGTSNYVTMPNAWVNPQTFSTEVWFRTSIAQGVLVGFSSSLLGVLPTNYDRHVYLISGGRLTFGVNNGGYVNITSPAGTSYADGAWHHMVATMGSAGMRLYVDGGLVASGTNTVAQSYTGYWRFAQNFLLGWPNAPASSYFSGQLAYGAGYPTALSAATVQAHYVAGV